VHGVELVLISLLVAVTQAYLTLSEVLGHVDMLLDRGEAAERETGGVIRYEAVS